MDHISESSVFDVLSNLSIHSELPKVGAGILHVILMLVVWTLIFISGENLCYIEVSCKSILVGLNVIRPLFVTNFLTQ